MPDQLAKVLNMLGASDFVWACFRLIRALGIAAAFVGTKYVLKWMIEGQTTSETFRQAFDTAADLTFLGLGLVITVVGVIDVAFVVIWDAWIAIKGIVKGERDKGA